MRKTLIFSLVIEKYKNPSTQYVYMIYSQSVYILCQKVVSCFFTFKTSENYFKTVKEYYYQQVSTFVMFSLVMSPNQLLNVVILLRIQKDNIPCSCSSRAGIIYSRLQRTLIAQLLVIINSELVSSTLTVYKKEREEGSVLHRNKFCFIFIYNGK